MSSQEIARKYNPSSRMVLYGCAAADVDERCSSSATADFDFEWAQVGWGNIVEHASVAVVSIKCVSMFLYSEKFQLKHRSLTSYGPVTIKQTTQNDAKGNRIYARLTRMIFSDFLHLPPTWRRKVDCSMRNVLSWTYLSVET